MRQHEGLVDPASLGFPPASTVAVRRRTGTFRSSTSAASPRIGDNLAGDTTHSIYSFQPTYTRMAGSHAIRGGYDLRAVSRSSAATRAARRRVSVPRQLHARSRTTRPISSVRTLPAFLLGQPTGGSIDRNGDR